jgi:hypothetical protein
MDVTSYMLQICGNMYQKTTRSMHASYMHHSLSREELGLWSIRVPGRKSGRWPNRLGRSGLTRPYLLTSGAKGQIFLFQNPINRKIQNENPEMK